MKTRVGCSDSSDTMGRRETWRDILESEVGRWSALSYADLIDALRDLKTYVVVRESKEYQVEVQLLETTHTSAQVLVSVDDGSLPVSLFPSTATFVVERS